VQGRLGLHHRHVQDGVQLWKIHPMEARRLSWPTTDQQIGQIGDFGPAGEHLGRSRGVQRVGLHREDVQSRARRATLSPQVQQGQDVQPCAKAQLGHRKASSPRPGLWQATALQEDRP